MLTDGGTLIPLPFFINKIKPNNLSATVSFTLIKIRQSGNYLINLQCADDVANSGIIFYTYYWTDNTFCIGCRKSGGFDGVNNDLISAQIQGTITFN